MNRNKYMKEYVDFRFFESPQNKLKSKFLSLKYHLTSFTITTVLPEIFICNKTSPFDKFFVSNTIDGSYVFLKDEYIEKLYSNTISKSEKEDLMYAIKELRNAYISIVIFPERHYSPIGVFGNIPNVITDFILETGYKKIKFLSLIGTFFIRPVWANENRICDTKIEQKFILTKDAILSSSKESFNEKFNDFMPSSASTYSRKIPIYMRSNKLAEDIETIFYACPNCNKLFTIYSEFNCVKCRDCGSAYQFSNNYEIELTRQFSTLEEARDFQFKIISSAKPNENIILTYQNVFLKTGTQKNKDIFSQTKMEIFHHKIQFETIENDKKVIKTIEFNKIKDFFIDYDNIANVTYIDENNVISNKIFQGKNKENFYIIIDLIEKMKLFPDKYEYLNGNKIAFDENNLFHNDDNN